MRLADDERARVPFALIGVLLLVGSLGVATVQFDDERVDADVRLAGDRAETTAESALRDAVADAGESAAATPVVEPAETGYGQLLAGERPFRSYLELLVALRLRERVDTLDQRVDRTTGTVELPPIENRSTAHEALNRTTVTDAGTGLVEATVENVTIVVHRDGAVVDERNTSLSVTVATSALTLHDRVTAFEERLDGGLATNGSVTRALTGGLYGLAWARGWGQYLGLPIDDPIANRHVELLTNLALIDAQRATLGGTDEEAEAGLASAAVRVAAEETVGFSEGSFADAGIPEPNTGTAPGTVSTRQPEETVVGVDETADRALADVLRSDPSRASDDALAARSLEALVRDALTVEAELVTHQDRGSRVLRDRTGPENESQWVRTAGEPSVSVVHVEESAGSAPAVGTDWTRARTEVRDVVLEETVPHVYEHRETGERRRGRATYRRSVEVGLAVAHRPKPVEGIPERPLGSEESADSVDAAGDVREGLVDRATRQLLGEGDDVDRLASRVARNRFERDRVTTTPEDVQSVRDAVYDDLAALREELRSVETETDRSFVATEEDPPGVLRDRLRDDRSEYVEAPRRYADLSERATVAGRVAFVDRVIDRLDTRSEVGAASAATLEDSAAEAGSLPEGGFDRLLEVGLDYARPEDRPLNATDPAPDLQLEVSGAPGYLEREAVDLGGESIDSANASAGLTENGSHYPLAVRTRTLPSLDTGDVADEVAGQVTDLVFDADDETVPLPMAARSLQGAERVPDPLTTAAETSLGEDRRALRAEVTDSVAVLEARSTAVVVSQTPLDDRRAEQVVDQALADWPAPADRALAFDDGTAAESIASTAANRSAVSEREADRLLTLLRDELSRELASESTHVRSAVAERVVDETRGLTEDVVADATQSGLESATDAMEDRFESKYGKAPIVGLRGVPLAPIPGYWAATANVWTVDVHGGYASFSARVPQGDPAGGGELRYRRDGTPAAVDVTGDGTPETLGHSTPVSFEASTTVVVVVPPSGGGVGNAEPDFGETSPGWEVWAESGDTDRGE